MSTVPGHGGKIMRHFVKNKLKQNRLWYGSGVQKSQSYKNKTFPNEFLSEKNYIVQVYLF
jgi:hypothetical protein